MAAPSTERESLGDLGRQIAEDATKLVRMEVELVKAEIGEKIKRGLTSLLMVVGAVAFTGVTVVLLLAALFLFLGHVIFDNEVEGLAVFAGGFFLVGAVVAGLSVRRLVATVRSSGEIVGTIKEDVAWAKRLTNRSDRSS